MKSDEGRIGEIGNYYGYLYVKVEEGKYFWSISDRDGTEWEEIPEYLYDVLVRFKDEVGLK